MIKTKKLIIPETEIEILSIVMRPWWQRIFTLRYWNVTYKIGDKLYSANLWAGLDNPEYSSIEYSLRKKLGL
jgi:hypothetical protein